MLRLREIRKNCGLTMKELAVVLGVAESTISQYETGKREPDFEMLLRMGEYFGVSVDYLLGKDSKNAPTQMDERTISDEEIMIAYFRGADPNLSREDMNAMWEDAKNFRDFIVAKRKREQNGQ